MTLCLRSLKELKRSSTPVLSPQVVQLNLHVPYQSTVPETPSGITETSVSHLSEPVKTEADKG